MNYQYLLFDVDGTLTDPKEGITKCVQYALRHFGIEEPELDKLTPFIGPPLIPSFMDFYGLTKEQADEAVDVYRSRFSVKGLYENEVYPGIPEMLDRLRACGKKLITASSKPEKYVVEIMKHFDLYDRLDLVVGAPMDENKAAKRFVIEDALKRMGITDENRSSVLMIGDRMHDVEGAKACGLDCLGTYIGFAEDGELEKAGATYVVHSVQEMTEFLEAH